MLLVRPQSRLLTVHARVCHVLGQLMAQLLQGLQRLQPVRQTAPAGPLLHSMLGSKLQP